MRSNSTAIIHLRGFAAPAQGELEPILHRVPGVCEVGYSQAEALLTVFFDEDRASLAQMVRAIEETGTVVAGIAHRVTDESEEDWLD